jgi:hypothetical protein
MHLDVLTSYRAEKEDAGRIAGVIRASVQYPADNHSGTGSVTPFANHNG